MDVKDIMLSEISQTEKDKYYRYHLYIESKKYNQLLNVTKKKQTHRYIEQTSGYQLGGRVDYRDRGGEGINYWV